MYIKKHTMKLEGEPGKPGCQLIVRKAKTKIHPAISFLRKDGTIGENNTSETCSYVNRLMQYAKISKRGRKTVPVYLMHKRTPVKQTIIYLKENDLSNTLGLDPLTKNNKLFLGTIPVSQ